MLKLLRGRNKNEHSVVFALSNAAVKFVVARWVNNSPELIVSDQIEVPAQDYGAAMLQLANQYSRFTKGNPRLAVVLEPSLYQSVAADRPNLQEESEIAAALKYSLRDLVSLNAADIIADYYELPIQLPNQSKINAIVADRQLLQPLVEVALDLSSDFVGIFPAELALAALIDTASEPVVIAYQSGQEPALLQVSRESTLQVNRVVRPLEKLSELSFDEIKLGGLQPLSVEIQRSADYFERQLRQRPIKKAVLAAALPNLAEVTQQLSDDLGLTVEVCSYPAWAKDLAAGDFSDFPALGGLLLLQQGQDKAKEDAA
ncbi:hypothetical protein CWE22_06710 [Pseudidiomarina aestuarii]|uniref:MSHA biogenesis protein MshI n=1 Tax=Pseudidiomarina aestuarii TaxID=624146 RepID=A0A7Z6ZUW3_9GAMM|nr:hypothetical protein [Pseudidiomarina aestuarii]RUO41839.1 hypothetical protein CWE22_06710 [Pseudidiomarina aestuarii]